MKWCLMLLFSLAAFGSRAFVLSYNGSGNVAHWSFAIPDSGTSTNSFNTNSHAIRYYIASNGSGSGNTAGELNAVRNSFGQWQSVPNALVKFEEAGLAPANYNGNTSDNSNVVFWATGSTIVNGGLDNISGTLGVTFSSFSVPGNIIRQFDIVINAAEHSWFTDFNDKNNPAYFLEGTLLHEIGHALGLVHAAIGGATLLWAGNTGVDTEAGLSVDEIAFARTLYGSGNILTNLGNLKGTITKLGSPILGAAVILEGTNGNLAGANVSRSDGSYRLNAIPPGNYNVRVVPLDPVSAAGWLIQGQHIQSPVYDAADTSFLPTTNTPVTLTAGTTNTLDFDVTNGDPAFRITWIRTPSSSPGSYSIIPLPASMVQGQSNYTFGVFSDSLPTSGATFTITGNGLTLGSPTYQPGNVFAGLNGISVSISVASNATPGLRTIIITKGTDRALANGYLEILPATIDYNFDGLDDVFQRKYFFPFTATNAAPAADPDLDGMNNLAEYIAGTIPTNALSLLKMQSVTVTNTGRIVRWQSVSGKGYQVSSRSNLLSGAWLNIGSTVTATTSNALFFDPTATNGARFYRVQAIP